MNQATTNSPEGKAAPRVPARVWLCGLMLSGVFFAIYVELSGRFDRLGVYAESNTLFDADPKWRLDSFSTGWGWSDRNFVHPNLGNYFSIPIKGIAQVAVAAGYPEKAERQLRRRLGLLVAPTFGAATVLLMLLTLWRCGLSLPAVLAAGVLTGASFSQLIFASIPDHFAVGGCCMAAATLLALEMPRQMKRRHWVWWSLLGKFTMGITVTNYAWLALLFWLARWHQVGRQAWRATAILTAVVIGLTVMVSLACRPFYPTAAGELVTIPLTYHQDSALFEWDKGLRAPFALANAVSPHDLATKPKATSGGAIVEEDARQRQMTVERTYSYVTLLLLLPLMIVGTSLGTSSGGRVGAVVWGSLLIVISNLLLHTFYGSEYFLYSQHWLPAQLFLIAHAANGRRGPQVWSVVALACVAIGAAVQNYLVTSQMLEDLARMVE